MRRAGISTRAKVQAEMTGALGFRATKNIAARCKSDAVSKPAGSKRGSPAPPARGRPTKVPRVKEETVDSPPVVPGVGKRDPKDVIAYREVAAVVKKEPAGRMAPEGSCVRNVTRSGWSLSDAEKHLNAAGLEELIKRHGMPTFYNEEDIDKPSHFQSLAKAIVFQQLAGAAASTIWRRFCVHVSGDESFTTGHHPAVTCERVAALDAEKALELCGIGISRQKASYLRDLAAKFQDPAFCNLEELSDADLRARLLSVKGVGPWTVDMHLMFTMHRPDILPVGDLGVRKGIQGLFHLKSLPAPAQMEALAASWAPYRSVGSWFMWKVAGTIVPNSKK